jgi:hypothetical protein
LIWGALEAIVDSDVALGSRAIEEYQPHVDVLQGDDFEDARQRGRCLAKPEGISAAVELARTMRRDSEDSALTS